MQIPNDLKEVTKTSEAFAHLIRVLQLTWLSSVDPKKW